MLFKEGDIVTVESDNILDQLMAELGYPVKGLIISVNEENQTAKIWGEYDLEMMLSRTNDVPFEKLALVCLDK